MSTGIVTDICQTSLELDTRLRTTRLNSESERLAERMTAVGAANWAPGRLGLGVSRHKIYSGNRFYNPVDLRRGEQDDRCTC